MSRLQIEVLSALDVYAISDPHLMNSLESMFGLFKEESPQHC